MPDGRRLVVTENISANGVVGGELGVTGSIGVVHALMRADLVDEYRLFVYPVLSSRGRNLVPAGLPPQALTSTGCTAFRSGVVLQVYTRR